jgi:hypothetical protein
MQRIGVRLSPDRDKEANEIFAVKDVADRFTTTGMTLPIGLPKLLGEHATPIVSAGQR